MSDPRGDGPPSDPRVDPPVDHPVDEQSLPSGLWDDVRPPGAGPDGPLDLDAARIRLEDLLLSLPYDRALPDLPDLLRRAGVPDELLRRDDRLLKVLQEAALARPLGEAGQVERIRTEIELLTLEVEVLTDRLASPSTPRGSVRAADRRLAEVSARLQEIQGVL